MTSLDVTRRQHIEEDSSTYRSYLASISFYSIAWAWANKMPRNLRSQHCESLYVS